MKAHFKVLYNRVKSELDLVNTIDLWNNQVEKQPEGRSIELDKSIFFEFDVQMISTGNGVQEGNGILRVHVTQAAYTDTLEGGKDDDGYNPFAVLDYVDQVQEALQNFCGFDVDGFQLFTSLDRSNLTIDTDHAGLHHTIMEYNTTIIDHIAKRDRKDFEVLPWTPDVERVKNFNVDRTISVSTGSFAVSVSNTSLSAPRKLAVVKAVYKLKGKAVALNAQNNINLIADTGEFALTGEDASVRADRFVYPAKRKYSLKGKAAALHAGKKINPVMTLFRMIANDATLRVSRVVKPNKRIYTLTGNPAGLNSTGMLSPEKAVYTVTANDVGLRWDAAEEFAPNYEDEIFNDIQKVTVTYTTGKQMDIYFATENTSENSPVWFVLPPGGSDRTGFTTAKYADAAARRGYIGVAIDFDTNGLSEEDQHRAGAIYAWAAIRYIKAHAATYGADENRVFISGQSLGGIIARLAALAWNDSSDSYWNDSFNSSVNSENASFSNAVLAAGSAPGAVLQMYLDDYLNDLDVPHYAWHGDQDTVIPIEWDQNAIEAMQAVWVDSTLDVIVGADHSLDADVIIPLMAAKFAPLCFVTLDTAGIKAVETKLGVNINSSDVNHLADWSPQLAGLFQIYYWFNFDNPDNLMDESAATIINALLADVDADIMGYYPIQYPEVVAAFPEFYDWLKTKFGSRLKIIQDDQETIKITHGSGVGMTNEEYIERCEQLQDYDPDMIFSLDPGLIYKENANLSNPNATLARNLALAPLTTFSIARQYAHISDLKHFGTDQEANRLMLKDYFRNMLPQFLIDFFTRFPNIEKQLVAQFHTEDLAATLYLTNKPMGNYANGMFVRHILANTELYNYIFYMALGRLFDNDDLPEGEYDSLKLLSECFKCAFTLPVSFPFPGVKGLAFSDGGDHWSMIIMNESAYEHPIRADIIAIPGKTITGNFTRKSLYAGSWDAAVQYEESTEAVITTRKFSTTWVEFDTEGVLDSPTLHKVFPDVTDPSINVSTESEYYCYVPDNLDDALGKLVVYLPGSGSVAAGCQLFMNTAKDENYHVIGLNYAQNTSDAPCSTIAGQGAAYLDLYYQELLFGGDTSPLAVVDAANSAENRLKKLLEYLIDTFPTEGWDTFLVGGDIQYNLITMVGHSRGGGLAAFWGKYRELDRVNCYSSPRELCHYDLTDWEPETFLTPIEDFRFFTHTEDNFDKQQVTITNMGVTEGYVDVELDTDSNDWFNYLVTSLEDVLNAHKSTLPDDGAPLNPDGTPRYATVWRKFLE